MKKHYKGLTVLLSACMLAGSASVAYAGPADDIANGTVGMPNTGSSITGRAVQPGNRAQDEDTALHVGVNYLYNAEGDISAFAMDLKNFEGSAAYPTVHIPTQAVICGGIMTASRPAWLAPEAG